MDANKKLINNFIKELEDNQIYIGDIKEIWATNDERIGIKLNTEQIIFTPQIEIKKGKYIIPSNGIFSTK